MHTNEPQSHSLKLTRRTRRPLNLHINLKRTWRPQHMSSGRWAHPTGTAKGHKASFKEQLTTYERFVDGFYTASKCKQGAPMDSNGTTIQRPPALSRKAGQATEELMKSQARPRMDSDTQAP